MFSLPAAEHHRKCLLIICCTHNRNKYTCASCLCLSGDKMAAMASTKLMRPALLWKLLYGSILSSMKLRGEFTRLTQFVRCVDLNLNISATQLILETTNQPENDRAGGGTASSELWESEADYQIHCKFYCIGFKTIQLWRTSFFGVHSRAKIQNTISTLLHWHNHNNVLQWN